MKALLMKDLRTLKNERRLWVSIIGVSVLFGVLFQNWYFMMGYIMFGLSMIARTNVSIRCGGPGNCLSYDTAYYN